MGLSSRVEMLKKNSDNFGNKLSSDMTSHARRTDTSTFIYA